MGRLLARLLFVWGVMAVVVPMVGCLSKPRTPYNELDLFPDRTARELRPALPGEEGAYRETLNLWPLYLSDGRARYALWPLIKSSPGCFAVQPFYNYDHGIQDFLWLLTLSPESGEYRLWPLVFRSPEWWMVLPLAYGTAEGSYGSPLLFNRIRLADGAYFSSWLNLLTFPGGWVFLPFAGYNAQEDYTMHWLAPLWFRQVRGEDWSVLWTPLSYYDRSHVERTFHVGPLGLPLAGRTVWKTGRSHWFVPFWYREAWADGDGTLWTLLSYYDRSGDRVTRHLGPFGLPFAASVESPGRSFRRALLVSHDTCYETAEGKRGAPYREAWGVLFDLLWKWERRWANAGQERRDEGVAWSLLCDFLGWEERTRQYETGPVRRTCRRAFGWLLWRWAVETCSGGVSDWEQRTLFTPLLSRDVRDGTEGRILTRHGFLLDAFSWETEADGDFSRKALWGLLFKDGCESWGNTEIRARNLLCGLLFDQSAQSYRHEEQSEEAEGGARVRRLTHSESATADLLLGLLGHHRRSARQTWAWPDGEPRPDAPTETHHTERATFLTPLVYASDSSAPGTVARRGLLGILFDHTRDGAAGTESFGILGYLYRSNHYADGTRARTVFPFVTHVSNPETGAWSFSILHKFFRVEHGAEGTKWWFLWL